MLLNAFYDFGNKIGPILMWTFILAMTVLVAYAMAKFLGGGRMFHRGERVNGASNTPRRK